MTSVTDGQASLDGCPAVATMFTLVTGNGEWREALVHHAGDDVETLGTGRRAGHTDGSSP